MIDMVLTDYVSIKVSIIGQDAVGHVCMTKNWPVVSLFCSGSHYMVSPNMFSLLCSSSMCFYAALHSSQPVLNATPGISHLHSFSSPFSFFKVSEEVDRRRVILSVRTGDSG